MLVKPMKNNQSVIVLLFSLAICAFVVNGCVRTVIRLDPDKQAVAADIPKDRRISARYGAMGLGIYDFSRPEKNAAKIACPRETRFVLIERDWLDILMHASVGGVYTTRSVSAACRVKPEAYALLKQGAAISGKNPRGALALFQQALLLDPDYVAALHMAGQVSENLNKPKDAVAFYEKQLTVQKRMNRTSRPSYKATANRAGNIYRIQLNNICKAADLMEIGLAGGGGGSETQALGKLKQKCKDERRVRVATNYRNLTQKKSCPGCFLGGTKLDLLNLTGANLSQADMRGAKFFGTTLRNANLRGANLTGADFRGAKIQGADFGGADLTNATLQGAKISETKFEGAIFKNTTLPDGKKCTGDCAGRVK